MCRAVTCNKCKKQTWAGCGAHIEQVLGHVPKSERCQCPPAAGFVGTVKKMFGF